MKKLAILAVLLSLSVPLATQTTHKKDGKPRSHATAVVNEPSKQLMQRELDAWSSGNFDNVTPFFDKNPANAYYDVMPLKYTGLQQYIDGVKAAFGGYQAVKLSMNDDAQVHRSGNMAYGAATIRLDLTDKAGKSESLDCRWTVVWEKKGEDWLVVHEHTSAPLQEAPKK